MTLYESKIFIDYMIKAKKSNCMLEERLRIIWDLLIAT